MTPKTSTLPAGTATMLSAVQQQQPQRPPGACVVQEVPAKAWHHLTSRLQLTDDELRQKLRPLP